MKLLRSNDDTEAENEVDERTSADDRVDDGTTARPTFTPADEAADDRAVPDDTAAATPTLVEPAADYTETGAPAADYTDAGRSGTVAAPVAAEPAADYSDEGDDGDLETDEPVAAHTTGEPAADYADETAADYTDAEDEPVTVYDETPATTDAPVVADAEPTAPVPVASTASTASATPGAAPGLDQPLLSGDTELLTAWQRVQAEFVDDPQVAVAGAADLVEQAGQALVDALQQRQRQMRSLWDHSSANGAGAPADAPAGNADTEQLRLMMQRYRALFNQLYQPV